MANLPNICTCTISRDESWFLPNSLFVRHGHSNASPMAIFVENLSIILTSIILKYEHGYISPCYCDSNHGACINLTLDVLSLRNPIGNIVVLISGPPYPYAWPLILNIKIYILILLYKFPLRLSHQRWLFKYLIYKVPALHQWLWSAVTQTLLSQTTEHPEAMIK